MCLLNLQKLGFLAATHAKLMLKLICFEVQRRKLAVSLRNFLTIDSLGGCEEKAPVNSYADVRVRPRSIPKSRISKPKRDRP